MRHSQLQSLLHKATSVPSPRRFPQQHFIPVLPRAPRANLCLFVFFREIFGNSGRELWEKGGLGHFLVTRPFCSGLLTNNSPEQPLLRNQVTVQQPAPIPCWTWESCLQYSQELTQPTARGATMRDHTSPSARGCTHSPRQVQAAQPP